MPKRTRLRTSIAGWSEPSHRRRTRRDRRLQTESRAGPRPVPPRYRVGRSPMTKLPWWRTGQCCHQVVDHAGRGFAPMMILEIAGNGSVGMMRAIPDVVDDGALAASSARIQSCSVLSSCFGEEAARHPGLVGEEKHEISGVVQPADRLRRIRHPADAVAGAHIAVIMVDDAVAVEKGGGLLAQDRTFRVAIASLGNDRLAMVQA